MSVLLSQHRITDTKNSLPGLKMGIRKLQKQKTFLKQSKQNKPHDNSEPSGIIWNGLWNLSSLHLKYRRYNHTAYMIPCLSSRGFFFPTAFHLFPYLSIHSEWSSPNLLSSGPGGEQNIAKLDEFLCWRYMTETSTTPRTWQKLQRCLFFSGPVLLHSSTSFT